MRVLEGRPTPDYPARVPLKVIGRAGELQADMIAALILAHLGPQPDGDHAHQAACKGAYISYTFWITLGDETLELPLRQALERLPGYVMQL